MDYPPTIVSEKEQRDYRLVCKARDEGDESAYASLMKYYRQTVYLLLLKMVNDPTEADDLTVETFTKAFCGLKSYAPVRPFSSWLFSIACNHCIDYIRKQHMQTVMLDDLVVNDGDDKYNYQFPSNIGNPEDEMVRSQRHGIIREVVQQMPVKYRRVIELRYYQEYSYDEIAKELKMPINTVRIHLHRAHELLQNILKEKKGNM